MRHIFHDILARYLRMLIGAENVLFVCGTDDHGSAGEVVAVQKGVTVRESTISCNTAVAPNGHAGGGINSDGSNVTINGSDVQGNTAVGENAGDQANQIFTDEGEIIGTGNTINDDTSVCAPPTPPTPPVVNFTG